MMHARRLALTALLGVAFTCTPLTAAALDPAPKCEFNKLKVAGKYGACRLGFESKAVKDGEAPDYSKCTALFSEKWQKIEEKAGSGVCPSDGDEASMNARITTDAAEIATLLAGGTLSDECGDGMLDAGEQCDMADLAGATCESLGYTLGGTLACDGNCDFDTSACASQQFPASGQTTAHGTGSDGDVQAGAALGYVDNGDGTITDLNTGLNWEKKDDSGGIHDWDTGYTWSTGTNDIDGTILTTFLATINGGGGFAGYTDWRIPNARELQSIVDYQMSGPSVDPAFHQSATCTGCTDVTLAACSCSASSGYWSSSTLTGNVIEAWNVLFSNGGVNGVGKTSTRRVRAVRGGL